MDTKDTRPDVTTPGVMLPNSATLSTDPEMLHLAETPVVPPQQPLDDKKTKPPLTPFQESLRRFLRDKRSLISLSIILFFVLLAIVGPPIYQHIGPTYKDSSGNPVPPTVSHDPFHHDIEHEDEAASAVFLVGTDSTGYDLLARLMQSILISISVALIVEIVDIVFGITVGVLAGYFGGWIDQLLARFTDIMFAFPGLLFAIMLTGILGPATDQYLSKIPVIGANGNARLILVSLALALTAWPVMARYVRGQTMQLKEQQFIEAARTSGTSNAKIILRHIIPNLFSIVIVASTLNIATTIVGEAGISALGLGVKAPGASLGLMISDAVSSADVHPWEVLFPCIVLAVIVLCFSFLGDGLRDAFDPRSKD